MYHMMNILISAKNDSTPKQDYERIKSKVFLSRGRKFGHLAYIKRNAHIHPSSSTRKKNLYISADAKVKNTRLKWVLINEKVHEVVQELR